MKGQWGTSRHNHKGVFWGYSSLVVLIETVRKVYWKHIFSPKNRVLLVMHFTENNKLLNFGQISHFLLFLYVSCFWKDVNFDKRSTWLWIRICLCLIFGLSRDNLRITSGFDTNITLSRAATLILWMIYCTKIVSKLYSHHSINGEHIRHMCP